MNKDKFDFSEFDMDSPPRDIELKDKHGKPIGLEVTVVSKYSALYQKALDAMQRRAAVARQRGKNLSADEQIDNLQRAFIARIDGWKIHGKFKDMYGEIPFNPKNAREIFFNKNAPEFSARIREQVDKVALELDEDFSEE